MSYYTAHMPFHDQLWTLIPFAFQFHSTTMQHDRFPKGILGPPHRKDGRRWFVHGWESDNLHETSLSINGSWSTSGKAVCIVYTTTNVCPGVGWVTLPTANEVDWMVQALQTELVRSEVQEDEKEAFAQLIERGLLKRDGDHLQLGIPAATSHRPQSRRNRLGLKKRLMCPRVAQSSEDQRVGVAPGAHPQFVAAPYRVDSAMRRK